MKFGITQLFNSTPKFLANLGHGLIAFSVALGIPFIQNNPKLAAIVVIIGAIGNLLANMFGEDKIKKMK